MNCVRAKHFGTFSHGVSVCEFVCIIRFSYSIIHYRKREKILGMYIYSMALVQLTYVGAGLDLITPRKCQQCSIETIRLRVWTHNAELNENRKKRAMFAFNSSHAISSISACLCVSPTPCERSAMSFIDSVSRAHIQTEPDIFTYVYLVNLHPHFVCRPDTAWTAHRWRNAASAKTRNRTDTFMLFAIYCFWCNETDD